MAMRNLSTVPSTELKDNTNFITETGGEIVRLPWELIKNKIDTINNEIEGLNNLIAGNADGIKTVQSYFIYANSKAELISAVNQLDIKKTYTCFLSSECVSELTTSHTIAAKGYVSKPADSMIDLCLYIGEDDLIWGRFNTNTGLFNFTLAASDEEVAQLRSDFTEHLGHGYGGAAVNLPDIASEEELANELEKILATMQGTETKMVTFLGYPAKGKWRWFGILAKSSDKSSTFEAVSAYAYGSKIFKNKIDGEWIPVEWENPPLIVGVEYRTTERWYGKSVYRKIVKYVNESTISGSGIVSIPHGVTDIDKTLGVEISVKTDGYNIPYIGANESTSINGCSATSIDLKTTGDTSWSAHRDWYFDMKYVKK